MTVVASRFTGGRCSNGAALSSIGVSWSIYNSVFTGNRAVGRGANPARSGTPGGGSGGGMYFDGNDFGVLIAGTRMTGNHAREGGGAVFFVSNDRSGVLTIRSSTLRGNPSARFQTDPGIYFLGRQQNIVELHRGLNAGKALSPTSRTPVGHASEACSSGLDCQRHF